MIRDFLHVVGKRDHMKLLGPVCQAVPDGGGHGAERWHAAYDLGVIPLPFYQAMDVDIGGINGGIPQRQIRCVLSLLQTVDKLIGGRAVTFLQCGLVFCHGNGQSQALLLLKPLYHAFCDAVA